MKNLVVIGLSGGIDSSAAAYLLKEQGYDVIALTLNLFFESDVERARRVAEHLNIPHFVLNLREEFRKEIMDYFASEYRKGRTPNPCAFCNPGIKFKYLLKFAEERGADFIATGHYARILEKEGKYYLAPAKDRKKSQEYFLALLNESVLGKTLFPLGELTKKEARKIIQEKEIPADIRKESQDICFIGPQGYADFLESEYGFKREKGKIISPARLVVGEHKGYYRYTIGQRRGIGISSTELPFTSVKGPLYVVNIDAEENMIMVGPREYLMQTSMKVNLLVWRGEKKGNYRVKIRYRHPAAEAEVKISDNEAEVTFKEPQFAPTPGQIAVFYNEEDLVIGAGTIEGMF